MSNDIVVWEAVKGVSNTLKSFIDYYKETHTINKMKKIALKNKIDNFLVQQKIKGCSEIATLNIQEIAKTQNLIDSLNLSDKALDMAMGQLDRLNESLTRILEDYCSDF